MKPDNTSQITTVRALALSADHDQLDHCLRQQIQTGHNRCYPDSNHEHVINVLAKAQFVRQLMAQGMSLQDALRELGKRIRALANPVKNSL